MYLPLRWCDYASRLFQEILGKHQYYPTTAEAVPENRLFGQFHAPQSKEIKHGILAQLTSQSSVIRVVFATIAMGLGVDIKNIRTVLHITPPRTLEAYYQEIGRAGRDGLPSHAILYYNNSDIADNVEIDPVMVEFCKSSNKCLCAQLLAHFATPRKDVGHKHSCCDVCQKSCKCITCVAQGWIGYGGTNVPMFVHKLGLIKPRQT